MQYIRLMGRVVVVRTDLSAGRRSKEDDAAERNEKGRGQLHVGQAGEVCCAVQN